MVAINDNCPPATAASELLASPKTPIPVFFTYPEEPFGDITARSGTLADENPFRFSTKHEDDETGLLYYGYRCYWPKGGRFISRDPAGEVAFLVQAMLQKGKHFRAFWSAGYNLSSFVLRNATTRYLARAIQEQYLFVKNSPIEDVDVLGLDTWCGFTDYWNCQPCNSSDQFGNRQAAEKLTNGCSFPGEPDWSDDPVGNFGFAGCSFLSACDAHDCCYGLCGAAKRDCDRTFHDDLQDICTSCCNGSFWCQITCDHIASAYYVGVRFGGEDAFRGNQGEFCAPCCCQN